MTIVGIPLALVLFAIFALIVLLSCVFVAYRLGAWTLRRPSASRPYINLAVGALLIAALVSLPWVGWLVAPVVLPMGIGALLLTWRDLRGVPNRG